jgi:ABC-2 type transport system permease protein
VPLAALGVEIGMFLPLAIAMLAGDAVAGEANLGTLRYLLTCGATGPGCWV